MSKFLMLLLESNLPVTGALSVVTVMSIKFVVKFFHIDNLLYVSSGISKLLDNIKEIIDKWKNLRK